MLKNDLFLRALRGEDVKRPPVWMMRQAGRYLPEFIELKNKYDFFTRCKTPEIATEITLQPIRRFPLDAAIIFSDILVVPQAMGLDFKIKDNQGPWLDTPIREEKDIDALLEPDIEESLGYVMEAIKLTKKELNHQVPLIGFAGSPWTILCYAIEGKGSKTFDTAKAFCFSNPQAAHKLLDKITQVTIAYLRKQIEAGADVIQVFDSWGGLLSPEDYKEFSLPYLRKITDSLKHDVPVILFAKGCWYALEEMSHMGAAALGVDWTVNPKIARELSGGNITLQGNFDPARLLSDKKTIAKMVQEMIESFGKNKYIANLGHGILPNVPIENAEAFVEAVVDYNSLKNEEDNKG